MAEFTLKLWKYLNKNILWAIKSKQHLSKQYHEPLWKTEENYKKTKFRSIVSFIKKELSKIWVSFIICSNMLLKFE